MNFLHNTLIDISATVFVLGVIIFCHEFGHFITAKAFGMRVFVFSFGFGQRLFGYKWGDTDLRVSLIPLGGYVKLEGEPDDKLSEDTSHAGDGRDFTARPRWQRIIVYLAGPFMNGVLTVSSLTVLYILGWNVYAYLQEPPMIATVDAGSPAASAGLRTGDEIVAIDGTPQKTWEDVLLTIGLRPETRVRIRYRRGGTENEVELQTRADAGKIGGIGAYPPVRIGEVFDASPAKAAGLMPEDVILAVEDKPVRTFPDILPVVQKSGGRTLTIQVWRNGQTLSLPVTPKDGLIGIKEKTVMKKFPPGEAFRESLAQTKSWTVQTLGMLHQLVRAEISPRNTFSGPIPIAQASGAAARGGTRPVLWLVGLLSLSVGILNLLPVPPLDGGHLAILYIESIARRDLSVQAKTWIINVGAVMVLALIVSVIYFDLTKMTWFEKVFGK
jgi:regulator of sigma E protease